MQDGRRDRYYGSDKEKPIDLSYDSVNEIKISRAADNAVQAVRRLWIFMLATPIAWAHLQPNAKAMRVNKIKKVREGTNTVLRIQEAFRTPALDAYFAAWSIFAEEEFYLVVIPALMWNVDYVFARHLNFVVCSGLLVGNTLKDVFRLPRPSTKRGVWRGGSAEYTDSTAMRDFGYPSTHAMNALSNTLLALLYCYCVPVGTEGAINLGGYAIGGYTLMRDCNDFPLFAAISICFVWFFSITFGRLYLGAHSPTDVRGGIVLGISFGLFWWYFGDHYDALTIWLPHLWVLVICLSFVIIILCPQPRPMTPTFLQNCLLVGLQAGCTLGFRSEHERRTALNAPRSLAKADEMYSWKSNTMRIIIGYTLVLATRQVMKTLLTMLLRRAFGIDPNPQTKRKLKVDEPNKSTDDKTGSIMDSMWGQHVPIDEHVPRVLEGWDLCGAAMVKFLGYTVTAWLITSGCPQIFEHCGLGTNLKLES